ncbi:hypothetical protein SSP35_22_00660 [Streptomyces sp. NBRC 110611]|uniref:DUF317 domain-containing protein n=1 Tax=Streptomyces sp. NBRC 110611 TaxID=1621259 RepID=UPI0008590911|nr:DUF317 domain-containing protein [Streptomyces sp. NBRC 110611]GAU70762.1 hypothetical protein SSP35_22_00660 [Streptomyces sp. NBRC 110611]
MPRVILTSPDQQAHLRLEPTPDDQWWRLHHAATPGSPAWWASFGARTPVELIAAVTDALTAPATPPTAATSPLEPLRHAGWSWSPNTRVSPDRIAEVEHFTDHGSNSWFITAALNKDPENQLWQAHFDGNTPDHLVTAFTRALADPAPLVRDPFRLPPRTRQRLHVRTEQLPADTVAFALERRVADLAARHPRTSTQSPAAGPPRLPKRRRTR